MGKIDFASNLTHTLGIELELGLVDGETMALSNSVQQVLDQLPDEAGKVFKPELMQCCLEINTGVCNTVGEAEQDLREKLLRVEAITDAPYTLGRGKTKRLIRLADAIAGY